MFLKLLLRKIGFSLIFLASLIALITLLIKSEFKFLDLSSWFNLDLVQELIVPFSFVIIILIIGLLLIIYSFKGYVKNILATISGASLIALTLFFSLPMLLNWAGSWSNIPKLYLDVYMWIYASSYYRMYIIITLNSLVLILIFLNLNNIKYKTIALGIILLCLSMATNNNQLDDPQFPTYIENMTRIRFNLIILTSIFFVVVSSIYLISQLKYGKKRNA